VPDILFISRRNLVSWNPIDNSGYYDLIMKKRYWQNKELALSRVI